MKIALLGDIALFGNNTIKNSQYKQKYMFLREQLDSCDYVIANLESPLTKQERKIRGKSAWIKGEPEDVEILKYMGITHVTLANNHVFDYREKGAIDTINILDKEKIEWYGLNDKVCTIEDGGNRLVLLGYCCFSTNGKGLRKKEPYVNSLDPQKIEKVVDFYIEKGYLPILSLHWGQEHVHYPNYDHIETARKLCSGRKMVVHGHHPHVIQGLEPIGDSIVAYSLGNCCFDDIYTNKSVKPLVKLSKDNKESFIWILNIENNRVIEYKVIPFSFDDESYSINQSIMPKLNEWSSFLNVPKADYDRQRNRDLASYINKRKKMRNLEWYLKRMNYNSVSMIIGAKRNKKKYNQVIRKYISD